MGEDNLSKTFEELRKKREIYGYSEELLTELENGNLNYLYEISLDDRNNKYFMEPLLFAVKNDTKNAYTYEVYTFYGPGLQKVDLEIAEIIADDRPDILKGAAVLKDPASVIYLAQTYPEVVLYMSEDLKKDGEFIEDLCKTGNREAVAYAIDVCDISEVIRDNPELASNPIFMKEAIKEDANALQYVDDSLKNNYEFIKEAAMDNRAVIDYVAEHTDDFGKEALDGARSSLEEHVKADVIRDVKKEREKIEEEKQQNSGEENEKKAEEVKKREHDLNSIEDTIRKFEETPEEKKPRRAHLILACAKDSIPEHYRKELEKYEQLYLAAREKELAEKNKTKVNPQNIENVSQDAKLSEIQEETTAIREEITAEREQTKENVEEIGE